jgi:hypothetical protein
MLDITQYSTVRRRRRRRSVCNTIKSHDNENDDDSLEVPARQHFLIYPKGYYSPLSPKIVIIIIAFPSYY